MSETVTWRDARAVFRLLDELKHLSHDPQAWRQHLLTGLSSLVGSQVGMAAEVPEGRFLDPTHHRGSVDTGWETAAERRAWMALCERTEPELDPSDARIAELEIGSYTLCRQELATDRSWYRSVVFNEHYRPARINHYLLSLLHVPGYRAVHYLFLFKAQSERPFDDRERQLVHHLHGELGELWREASAARLPRRLRQTLDLLQAGHAEKEVADRLQLSPQTVHDYCKALHKRLKVRSRAELLARARTLPQAPRLLLEEDDPIPRSR